MLTHQKVSPNTYTKFKVNALPGIKPQSSVKLTKPKINTPTAETLTQAITLQNPCTYTKVIEEHTFYQVLLCQSKEEELKTNSNKLEHQKSKGVDIKQENEEQTSTCWIIKTKLIDKKPGNVYQNCINAYTD